MAKKKLMAGDDVTAVWIAPESLRSARLQAAVDEGKSAQEIADIAISNIPGQYRESLGDEVIENVVTPRFGDLLVWVHPEGEDDGWFERYTGDPGDYAPIKTEA